MDLAENRKLRSDIVDVINSKDARDEKMSNAKNLLNTKFDEEVNLLEYLKVFQQ